MKKTVRIISVLLMMATIISAICSCKRSEEKSPLDAMTDREKAEYLSQKSDEYYADRMKTTSVAEMKVSGNISGVPMESTTKITQNAVYDKEDPENVNYHISSEVHAESKIGGTEKTEEYTLTEAYSDDYYIYSYETSDSSESVYQYSVCFLNTFENYLAKQEYFNLAIDENEDFETVSVTKDDKSGIYILKYSDPTVDLMRRVNRYIALMESGLVYDADFKSMSVEITVNAETMVITSRAYDLKAKTLRNNSYELEYDFKIRENFAKHAKLNALPENLEQKYVRNDNLILRQMALLELRKLASSEDVSFDIVSGVVDRMRESLYIGTSDKYDKISIHYGKRNGKFMYRLTDKTSDEVLYNGEDTFVLDGENVVSRTYTEEFDARTLIYSITVQPFIFDEYMINATEVEYDGQYVVCMPLKDEYRSEFLSKLGVGGSVPVQFVAYFRSLEDGYELVSFRLEAEIGQKNYYDYMYRFVEIRNISTADLKKAEEIEY